MKVHVSNANFENGSYSSRCQSFFDESDRWQVVNDLYVEDKSSLQPVVARSHLKSTKEQLLQIHQYGHEVAAEPTTLHIRHALFRVATLSMAMVDSAMYEFKRWYIFAPEDGSERIAYLKNLTPNTNDIEANKLHQGVRFVLNNNLYAPNRQEIYDLFDALHTE